MHYVAICTMNNIIHCTFKEGNLEILVGAEADVPLGAVSRYCLHQTSDLPALTTHFNLLLRF